MSMRYLFALLLLTAFLTQLGNAPSVAQEPGGLPLCPSGEEAPVPNYAPSGARPKVSLWTDLEARALSTCAPLLEGPGRLAAAIAARFSFSGEIDGLAERVGAVSETEGLHYWSTTEKRWRELIVSASALEGESDSTPRSDFLAPEVLSCRANLSHECARLEPLAPDRGCGERYAYQIWIRHTVRCSGTAVRPLR